MESRAVNTLKRHDEADEHNFKEEKEPTPPDDMNSSEVEPLVCAVCLQPYIHPARLPCGHVFCFLCVKGIAVQNHRCAMCRQPIPSEYLDNPELLNADDIEKESVFADGYQWFYEGRNGWWQYDDRTSLELESAFQKAERSCELLIAGFVYKVDFDNMLQVRKHDTSKRRRIKRDLASIQKKGVAGIRLPSGDLSDASSSASSRDDEDDNVVNAGFAVGGGPHLAVSRLKGHTSPSPIPVPPTNTPQTPHTPSANSESSSPNDNDNTSIQQAIQMMSSLRLMEADPDEAYADSDSSDTRESSLWTLTLSDEEQTS